MDDKPADWREYIEELCRECGIYASDDMYLEPLSWDAVWELLQASPAQKRRATAKALIAKDAYDQAIRDFLASPRYLLRP